MASAPLSPARRRAIGVIALLAYLPAYVWIAASLGGLITAPLAQLAFYAIAGFAWVAPLYPLFKWMRG
jgi:hypothetical protein